MRYFLVVGESSGDGHAARLMEQLLTEDPDADFAYMGGSRMRAVGGTCVARSEQMAYMGIVDVVTHYPKIRETAHTVQESLLSYRPDVVICVDYAGFCFQYILPFVRKNLPSSRIVYYIPPKVWAWKKHRIKMLRSHTDLVLCILPFEVPFFQKNQLHQAVYVGNPTYEALKNYRPTPAPTEGDYVALLCGSRRSEVKMNLPLMLRVTRRLGTKAVVAAAPGLDPALISDLVGTYPHVQVVHGDTYGVVAHARAALVTSGTATLETALLDTPQVVCYAVRGGGLANFVYTHFFTAPYISLVNLIADREVVPEMYGGLFRDDQVEEQLDRLLKDPTARTNMLQGYAEVRKKLHTPLSASEQAARLIAEL